MKINDAIKFAEEKFKEANILDYKIDGKLILFHLFNIDEKDIFLNGNKELSKEDEKRFVEIVEKRAKHIPIQEIFNETYFYGEKFKVNRFVLTPRKETEILVESCINLLKGRDNVRVLDLCTGSGVIGIMLKKNLPSINVSMSDISKEALEIAKENTNLHNVEIDIILSDLFNNIDGEFDMIVSNPPYIKRDEILELSEEVRMYDPIISLDGGIDGLDFYKRIAEQAKPHLKDNGLVAFEIGYDEGKDIKNILSKEGYVNIEIKKDYSGLDRIVFATYKKDGI